jgi:nitrogen fixation protein NifX
MQAYSERAIFLRQHKLNNKGGMHMPYKVAVTTSDGVNIDQHFGQTKNFHIIQIEEKTGRWNEVETRKIDMQETKNSSEADEQTDGCNGHNLLLLNYLGKLLNDCSYLLTKKIGRKPYQILEQNGIKSLESTYNLQVSIERLNSYYLKTKARNEGEKYAV